MYIFAMKSLSFFVFVRWTSSHNNLVRISIFGEWWSMCVCSMLTSFWHKEVLALVKVRIIINGNHSQSGLDSLWKFRNNNNNECKSEKSSSSVQTNQTLGNIQQNQAHRIIQFGIVKWTSENRKVFFLFWAFLRVQKVPYVIQCCCINGRELISVLFFLSVVKHYNIWNGLPFSTAAVIYAEIWKLIPAELCISQLILFRYLHFCCFRLLFV